MKTIHELVAVDLAERARIGLREYGRPLEPFNGRNALRDAYEEALDLACYLRQALLEQEAHARQPVDPLALTECPECHGVGRHTSPNCRVYLAQCKLL